jgi:AbrB family looped-hinge helix DNA binding protein
MQTVRVSPQFQGVIPKELRERLKLRPGQDMATYEIEGQIRLEVSHRPKSLRSMACGLQWKESDRDHAERL